MDDCACQLPQIVFAVWQQRWSPTLAFRTEDCSIDAVKWLTIALLPLLVGAPAGPTLGFIRLQLYYKTTGTLSSNIAPPAHLSLWNTGAGEGDVKEPAEDHHLGITILGKPIDKSCETI